MIRGYKDPAVEALVKDGTCEPEWRPFQRVALRKLDMLKAAEELKDLRSPPGNRLEALQGDRAGQYSIRINDQWRICFRWTPEGAEEVEICDYHQRAFSTQDPRPRIKDMARISTHPGEILKEEFLEPLGLSARSLAEELGVPNNRISELIRGDRGMTADTAIRLARHFDTTSAFWMNLQVNHDLSKAEAEHDYSNIRLRKSA